MNLRKIIQVSFVVGSLAVSASAFAAGTGVGIFAEPYAGYGLLGSTERTSGTLTEDTGKLTGLGFGARVGATFADMFFAGVDGSFYPSFSYSAPAGSVTSNADSGAKSLKLGLVAGVAPPAIPFRFWVGANLLDSMSDTINILGTNVDFKATGMSFKVGAGFRPIPLLSINAEFIMASYGSAELSASGQTAKVADFSASHKLLLLSASVPFDFPM